MDETVAFLRERTGGFRPRVGLVLGSGLGFFADESLDDPMVVPYADIPGFLRSTVEGHAGNLVFGSVGETPVVCMQGRFHFYEGYPLTEITQPVRVMKRLGIETLFLTNAAGGIREEWEPGTLMLIRDHINFLGTNPLIGPNIDSFGTRFPDMSVVYDASLRERARAQAASLGVGLEEGVYLATTGPSFETPAEIRAFRTLGADAVGMSTVPEAIVARHAGLRVIGISCITNQAAGISGQPLTHEEVAETANRVKGEFGRLVGAIVGQL